MRLSRGFIFIGALCAYSCNTPDPTPKDPEPQTAIVREALSDTSHPTRDDTEDGNERWGGAASTAYVGVSGACNSKPPSRKRYMNVRFDLSAIPTCATVTNVTVTFTQ